MQFRSILNIYHYDGSPKMTACKKKTSPLFCFALLVLLIFFKTACADDYYDPAFIEEGLTTQQYLNYATELQGHLNFDGCLKACQKVLNSDPDNAKALAIVAHSYCIQAKWDSCILYGNRAFNQDANVSADLFNDLFRAYCGSQNGKGAQALCKKMLALHPENNTIRENIANIEYDLGEESSFAISLGLGFLAGLGALLWYYLYRANKGAGQYMVSNCIKLIEVVLAAGFGCSLLYFIFFLIAPWVRSLNTVIPPQRLTPYLATYAFEHDGMEGVVLYSMILICIFFAYAFSVFSLGLRKVPMKLSVLAVFVIAGYFFVLHVAFNRPLTDPARHVIPISLITLAIIIPLYVLASRVWRAAAILCAIILIPISFISIWSAAISDSDYILSPALRIMRGARLSDIYFQYDLLLSLIACVGIKLNMPFAFLQHAGQLFTYLLFIGLLFLSRKLFFNKNLPILFLAFVVVIRFYANISDLMCSPQVTPMRLDLWFILLVLVYWKTPYHWSVGLAYAAMVVLHRNFGYIYLAAYLQLLFILWVADLGGEGNGLSFFGRFFLKIHEHFFRSWKNLLLILGGLIISDIVFGGLSSTALKNYTALGVGMIPISPNAFYWYVPLMLSVLACLLLIYRGQLNNRYFVTGLFVVLLSVGNSLYFLGRSHDNNLLNISAILSLALFILLDLLIFISRNTETDSFYRYAFKSAVFYALPFIAVVVVTYFYGARIDWKIKGQYSNLLKGETLAPLNPPPIDFQLIKTLTHNTDKVYFLDYDHDFLYYYYGNYAPQGYFSPCSAFITKVELANFMNKLLGDHYCVICRHHEYLDDISQLLSYNRIEEKSGYMVLERTQFAYSLSNDSGELMHIGFQDRLADYGLQHVPAETFGSFTIQCIVKPDSIQVPFATILDNSHATIGERGFSILQLDSATNTFIFSYGDNLNRLSSKAFKLIPGKWNLLTISADNNILKISTDGYTVEPVVLQKPIKGSNMGVWIENRPQHDRPFHGIIREIKISEAVAPSLPKNAI